MQRHRRPHRHALSFISYPLYHATKSNRMSTLERHARRERSCRNMPSSTKGSPPGGGDESTHNSQKKGVAFEFQRRSENNKLYSTFEIEFTNEKLNLTNNSLNTLYIYIIGCVYLYQPQKLVILQFFYDDFVYYPAACNAAYKHPLLYRKCPYFRHVWSQ